MNLLYQSYEQRDRVPVPQEEIHFMVGWARDPAPELILTYLS